MDFISVAVDFLTDPNSIGFPLLMIAGLGVILYLMNYTTKQTRRSDIELEKRKDEDDDMHIPHEPF